MKVIRFVNKIFNSNTFILYKNECNYCWLIDCGDYQPLLEWIHSNRKIISGIFITHTHTDHIYGLNDVVAKFPECIVYTSEKGKEGLYSDTLNLSAYHEEGSFLYKYNNVSIVKERDRIALTKDVYVNVMETPGHDWSCITYNIDDTLFTGDSFIPNQKVITIFPKSNKAVAEESITRILSYPLSTSIFPGHGIHKTVKDCIND